MIEIIKDYNYTTEDLNELILKESNENYYYFKNISYLLMVGTTVLSSFEINAEKKLFNDVSLPLTEFIANTSFEIEDYEQNVFSIEDYTFCQNNSNIRNLTEKILSFKSLQDSWDGFGAIPLEIKSATNAISFFNYISETSRFVNPNDIFPNPHGTISLIWENNFNERLSLEIGNTSLSYYKLINGNKPEFFNNIEFKEENIGDIAREISSLF